MSGYVSPLPTSLRTNYARRIDGRAQLDRMHIWHEGRVCNPTACRECYREQHWEEGQTHG